MTRNESRPPQRLQKKENLRILADGGVRKKNWYDSSRLLKNLALSYVLVGNGYRGLEVSCSRSRHTSAANLHGWDSGSIQIQQMHKIVCGLFSVSPFQEIG